MEESLFPKFEEVKKTRTGNKMSRFFRHVFEYKNIKKLFGTNLALMLIASSLLPSNITPTQAEDNMIIKEETVQLATKRVVQYPLNHTNVSQGYSLFHPGIDLTGLVGEEVRPIKDGFIEAVSNSKYGYGNAILVNHGNKLNSLYAHLSKINVFVGQEVSTSTIIGELGRTGHSTGPHLHLEIRDNGVPVSPFTTLPRSDHLSRSLY